MSQYIMPLDESLPTSGGQIVSHYVKIFSNPVLATLEADVNAFLLGLQADPEPTPYIRTMDFSFTQQGGVLNFSVMIHYFLVD